MHASCRKSLKFQEGARRGLGTGKGKKKKGRDGKHGGLRGKRRRKAFRPLEPKRRGEKEVVMLLVLPEKGKTRRKGSA